MPRRFGDTARARRAVRHQHDIVGEALRTEIAQGTLRRHFGFHPGEDFVAGRNAAVAAELDEFVGKQATGLLAAVAQAGLEQALLERAEERRFGCAQIGYFGHGRNSAPR